MSLHSELVWDDGLSLGFAALDETHREFVTMVATLQNAADNALPAALDAFITHAQSHFDQETAWMRDSAFPSMACHIEEHDKVLASVCQVRDLLRDGDTAIARELAQALAAWFPTHVTYMDAALTQWLARKRLGGAPVALRRPTTSAA